MPYNHGVYVYENPTSVVTPLTADSAVQVIVGTAPVNLLADPAEAVNKPILVNSFAEAQEKVGYSDSFDKFTICQSVDASFRVFNVAPLILINVLDPTVHKMAVTSQVESVENNEVLIDEEGILLDDTFVVESADGVTTYVKDTDYTVEFDKNGYVLVKIVSGGSIPADVTELSFDFTKLDPSAVTESDIIGGYDSVTGKYTGLANIEQVYPRFGIVPGLIVIPGWSHKPAVGAAMTAKTEDINGTFKCQAVKDVDTTAATGATVYSDVPTWKNDNSYTNKHDIVCWPMVKVGTKKYYYSAVMAALIAYTDAQNQGVPYVSPSNKQVRISGTILDDGTEIYLDQVQGNFLNGNGIVTAININGWKSWGNNTGIYPSSTDVKDRFIPARRMFDWWGNTFILTYFQKVDDPLNTRLIESIIDSENIRANGYKARQQIADAKIEFNIDENPTTDILNGTIRFKQYLTPYPPAETIINTLEFDPNALTASLGGE
jgi:hypothetical protein